MIPLLGQRFSRDRGAKISSLAIGEANDHGTESNLKAKLKTILAKP